MTFSPRAKLLALAALFFLPIAASVFTYLFLHPQATANYGELLPPSPAPAVSQWKGKWVIVVADAGACPEACRTRLDLVTRIRLALGRNASRVQRVFLIDGPPAPDLPADGLRVVPRPAGATAFDRDHIYLVDPHGDAMMRWPAQPDGKRMLKDLERLLKASQIG